LINVKLQNTAITMTVWNIRLMQISLKIVLYVTSWMYWSTH